MAIGPGEGSSNVQQEAPGVRAVSQFSAATNLLLRRAVWLGGHGRAPLVSFSSIFLALLSGADDAAWVRAAAAELGPRVEEVIESWRAQNDGSFPSALSPGHVGDLATVPAASLPAAGDLTPSARAVMREAGRFAARAGRSRVEVRDVAAVYVFGALHSQTLQIWKLARRAWAARFLVHVARAHPAEYATWRALSRSTFVTMESASLVDVRRLASGDDAASFLRALFEHGHAHRTQPVASAWLVERMDLPEALTGSADDLRAWLDEAAVFALCHSEAVLSLRHVVAALLSPRAPALVRGGAALARELCDLIARNETSEDIATWRFLVDSYAPAATSAPMPGYDNDLAAGRDLLDVEPDVFAMASVLAARETRPPLSVGLFGNWGSGKTFFINKLRDRIDVLKEQTREARKKKEPSSYCAEIVQIEFNAWHFMDADLWASMIDHTLDCVDGYLRRNEPTPREELAREKAAVDAEAAELQARRSALDASLARMAKRGREPTPALVASRAAQNLLDDIAPRVNEIERQLGLAAGSLTLEKVRTLERKGKGVLGSITRGWMMLRQRPALRWAVLAAILVVAAGAALTYVWDDLMMVTASAAGTIAVLGGWLAKLSARARPMFDRITEIADKAKELAAEAPATTEPDQLEMERALLDAREKALETRAKALEARRMAQSTRGFVQERLASGYYRERLGIISNVRRDLEELEKRMNLERPDESPLERIILYVDDLDRCAPDRVVQVLQAIHLLVSSPLFIVVVAVDSRWLLRSLEAYYAKQFDGIPTASNVMASEDDARPQHYLEKIFQIPYTLVPMDAGGFGALVDGLLGRPVKRPSVATAPEAGPEPAPPPVEEPAPTAAMGEHRPAAPAPGAAAAPAVDLVPANLELEPFEVDHLRTLGDLIPTPRAAKRLFNLYRVVRASLDEQRLKDLVGGRYQVAQLWLAAVVGCPDLAAACFEEIFEQRIRGADALRRFVEQRRTVEPRWLAFEAALGRCGGLDDWPRVVEVCRVAARYSFETGRTLA